MGPRLYHSTPPDVSEPDLGKGPFVTVVGFGKGPGLPRGTRTPPLLSRPLVLGKKGEDSQDL